jgi:hypothetical protein
MPGHYGGGMCLQLCPPDGRWLGSVADLLSVGGVLGEADKHYVAKHGTAVCLCGIDVDGALDRGGVAYTYDPAGFYDLAHR